MGLRPVIVPARTGAVLDRKAAASDLVRGLSSFERMPVALPVRADRPRSPVSALSTYRAYCTGSGRSSR